MYETTNDWYNYSDLLLLLHYTAMYLNIHVNVIDIKKTNVNRKKDLHLNSNRNVDMNRSFKDECES